MVTSIVEETESIDQAEVSGGEAVNLRSAVAKWGDGLMGGFQIAPDLLFRYQHALELSATDLVVLLHLTMAWWEADRPPYPRVSTMARRMGASERTVQRSLSRLTKLKLINRILLLDAKAEKRQAFDLTLLAERLKEIASSDILSSRRRTLRNGAVEVHTQLSAQVR